MPSGINTSFSSLVGPYQILLKPDLDPAADKLEALRKQAFRMAYYVAADSSQAELGGEMVLAMLMKEYGVSGNAELQMMKIISRVSMHIGQPDASTK